MISSYGLVSLKPIKVGNKHKPDCSNEGVNREGEAKCLKCFWLSS